MTTEFDALDDLIQFARTGLAMIGEFDVEDDHQ